MKTAAFFGLWCIFVAACASSPAAQPPPSRPGEQSRALTEHAQASDVEATKSSSNSLPMYPSSARQFEEEGTVIVHVHIEDTGRVDNVEIQQSSGFAALDRSAVEAVRTTALSPQAKEARPYRPG
jgi:protein TonB